MGIFDGGSLFDGSGSFGLGLGGFDISDFSGLTGDGGFGSMNFDTGNTGLGLNNVGTAGKLDSFDKSAFDTISKSGWDSDSQLRLADDIFTGAGFSGGETKFSNSNMNTTNNTSGSGNSTMDWVLGAANLANSLYKDKDARDYRDDVFNNQVKTQNDSLEGKKQLVNTYYGVSAGDSAEEAAAKSNNNPTLTRDSYSTR